MSTMLDELAVALIPMCGIMAMLLICCVLAFICDIVTGDYEMPKLRRKKTRNIQRGVVGQKIRRTKYEYIEIIPDYSGSGKRFRVRRVRR